MSHFDFNVNVADEAAADALVAEINEMFGAYVDATDAGQPVPNVNDRIHEIINSALNTSELDIARQMHFDSVTSACVWPHDRTRVNISASVR